MRNPFTAELGSICKSRSRSCTINQDNGLTLAHTIAHEIGHTLRIPHDPPDDPRCGGEAGNFVMAPRLETDIRSLRWSPCSREHLNAFLEQEVKSTMCTFVRTYGTYYV